MARIGRDLIHKDITRFDRHFFDGKDRFTYIGSGSIGGKAQGLANMKRFLESQFSSGFDSKITVNIPTLTVITTEFFDLFMEQNDLYEIAYSDMRDDLIAHAFQKAELPVQLLGDLRALISQVKTPLAIRSSSMLEDAMFEPFASVYETKMIPNNQHDVDMRFKKLVEAIKFIYASTFFKNAKSYMQMTRYTTKDEKMAVIIQEVVGCRYGNRFYPNISGVARSYNFYAFGELKKEDGVIDLALGLGKIVVDDGISWSYSPSHPQKDPPYNNIGDLLKQSQTEFWAINMGKPPIYDPIKETEYLMKYNLKDAEYDNVLNFIASTYIPQDDKIVMGVGDRGPRILNFAPILRGGRLPLNELLKKLLEMCEDTYGTLVEIEFAVNLDKKNCAPANFGFLQVRPMVVTHEEVEVSKEDMNADNVLLASENVIGNGFLDNIKDIVFVRPENFSESCTQIIAEELDKFNHQLIKEKIPYLLIGFGRWGTSDPQAGIPVKFGQISGAKVIVEATLPDMNFGLSQGSHFFHNITSFKIFYFSIYHWSDFKIKWDWLNKQNVVSETKFVRHIKLNKPLLIKVDGRKGRGLILYEQ
ncbi:MAG: PEP/pyruvate-binding domain-containing protein [bacterium]